YTLGKAIDDSTDINQALAPQNPLNARDERSLSSFDVRHRLVISGIMESPFRRAALRDFVLSPIFTYRSGYPFNLLLGVDPDTGNFNAVNTQRPAGAGRNTGRGPDYYSFDLRLARKVPLGDRFSMEWIAEGFNLFNRTNFKAVNRTVGSFVFPFPTFRVSGIKGRPSTEFLGFTDAYDPRQFQLALKFNF
ncbi:MAG: TonB-dependent receptor, partial [Gammaproteobacteria bacterium]